MKTFLKISLLIVAYGINLNLATAQDLTKKYKKEVIETLSGLMNDYYVFPEVAQQTEEHLKKQFKQGYFKTFKDNETFATALTESVQSVNHDKHMRIWVNPPYEAQVNTPERSIEEQLDRIERQRFYNAGFNTVQVLEGNVGYIDIRGFAGLESGKEMADAYMKLIANSDAVIIDLGKNGGGSPKMVQYLCSYFFDTPVHLNSLYFRE